MSECPKCGSFAVSGPTYCAGQTCRAALGSDHLHYACRQCGYLKTARTRDWATKSDGDDLEPLRK